MEGVWQQTNSPDANSSETFIHTPTHTYSHTNTPSYLLSRALSRPYFLLSDYLRTCSTRASWEYWNLLDFPSSLSAKGRHPGRRLLSVLANAHPQRRRMGRQIKAKTANTVSAKLCSTNSPAWIASPPPPPHIFVSVSSA